MGLHFTQLSLSPYHHPDMTKILLKRIASHLSIHLYSQINRVVFSETYGSTPRYAINDISPCLFSFCTLSQYLSSSFSRCKAYRSNRAGKIFGSSIGCSRPSGDTISLERDLTKFTINDKGVHCLYLHGFQSKVLQEIFIYSAQSLFNYDISAQSLYQNYEICKRISFLVTSYIM